MVSGPTKPMSSEDEPAPDVAPDATTNFVGQAMDDQAEVRPRAAQRTFVINRKQKYLDWSWTGSRSKSESESESESKSESKSELDRSWTGRNRSGNGAKRRRSSADPTAACVWSRRRRLPKAWTPSSEMRSWRARWPSRGG